MLNKEEMPLREEIQVVPERANEYQQMIDDEFANQEVTMLSSDEVDQTVNSGIEQVEAPARVSKYSQKEINIFLFNNIFFY